MAVLYIAAFFFLSQALKVLTPGSPRPPWATLSVAAIGDPASRRMWCEWMEERLHRHRATDRSPLLQAVRLAADGAWLWHGEAPIDFRKTRKTLLALTREG